MRSRDRADTVQLSKVRIRESLRSDLEEAASTNQRTLNAEIAYRLEQSFQGIESAFGGKAGLQLAIMIVANFKFAGDQLAAAHGHPEWTPAEWLRDSDCFEGALAALVDSVWAQHPKPGSADDYYNWLGRLWARREGRRLTEQLNAASERP